MDFSHVGQKVSVIIPAYNRARFIPSAVQSVINQDYHNIEIIIVDDRSTDDTDKTVQSLQESYPQICYLKNSRSKGPSGARNTGLINATGDFIAFLDSDDQWHAGHIGRGIDFLEKNIEVDVLFGNYRVIDLKSDKTLHLFFDRKTVLHDLDGHRSSEKIKTIHDNVFLGLVRENFFDLGTAIVRKKAAERVLFDEAIMFSEDCDFAIKLFRQAHAVFAVREDPVLSKYVHESNLYFSKGQEVWHKTIHAHLYLFEKYLRNFHLSPTEKKVLKELIAKRLRSLSYINRSNRKYARAFKAAIKSFRYDFALDQYKEVLMVLLTFLFPGIQGKTRKLGAEHSWKDK